MKVARKLWTWALALCATFALVLGLSTVAYAAAGDVPDHEKILTQNDDGTYTIALNVTGDSEKKPQKVNVIVIVDRSGSMNEQSGTGAYVASNSNGSTMYGFIDGEYVLLQRRSSGGFFPTYTYWYNGTQYTGQRYIWDRSATRLEATKAAVNGLSNTLLGYNGQDGNPTDTVEMALVSFATAATTNVAETTDPTTFTNAVNGLTIPGGDAAGTNWEAALRQADSINFGDSDPTYVIFFSDGAPTFYLNAQGGTAGSGYEEEPNMSYSYNAATDDAAALATKVGTDRFYTIFAYGSNAGRTYMANLTAAAGAPAENNYSASNTAELEEAFAAILEAIEMSGIGNASLTDGTTSSVTTTTGEVSNLLTVDTDSYKYYRAGGTENGEEKYDSSANNGLGEEWADAPAATFENGAVKWDLSDEGVLENDVTYTVTFDCWPSQTTLDIVADIKNNPSSYNDLDENIKKYITPEGDLATNTTATLSYTDTRTGKSGSSTYVNPDSVGTTAVEQLAVSKKWQNAVDGQQSAPITLEVMRDTTHKYDLVLSSDNNWKGSVFISIGIMRTGDDGNMEILEPGHDFTFVEPEEMGYRWELDVPTVHPMLINGELTTLIKVDDAHPAPAGADTYTINGATYYADETGAAALTATNYRRSQLELTKAVEGEAPEDATFSFTVSVTNSKASEGEQGDTDTDYYVWFTTIDDAGENTPDVEVSGATRESEGSSWFYAESGATISVDLPAGYKVLFINLPKDSSYTIEEGDLDTGYIFKGSELSGAEDESFDVEGQTSTGTIADWNSIYTVTYTNEYALVDITATKVWDDASDQDGIRPDKLELTLNNLPPDIIVTPEITGTDGNTWTYTWKGVPKYDADGEVITYTVSEGSVPTGYTCEKTTVDAGGTITNKHTPEVYETVTVKKSWDDNNNQDGVRPDSVSVQLKADGENVGGPVTLNADNSWSYTWKNLPKKSDGTAIKYEVEETNVPAGYDVTVTGDVEKGFTVTNKHTPDTTEATIVKVWEDNDNQDGKRPETLKVTLSNGTEVTLPQDGKWTATVTGLPKYNNGVLIEYSWTEETVDEYSVESNKTEGTVTTITNKHTPETTSATVTKEWSDNDDQDGIRPSSVVVVLSNGTEVTLPNADGTWTATVSNLPKYADGQEIAYTWTEKTVPDGYTVSYGEDGAEAAPNKGTITNTHTPSTIDIPGTKTWVDADNQDGKRPESITVNLLANGEKVDSVTVTPAEDGTWSYTFEGVPEYANGKKIEYTVTEEKVDGYDVKIDGYNITNTHTPSTIDIEVEKIWVDADNQDGLRPGSITVNLLANGEKVQDATITPAEDGKWTYTFEGVPEFANGKKIEYTVTEETVEGYDPTIDGYLITNTHEPEKTFVTVTKTWDDADNQDGLRPGSITVNLLANGEKIKDASVTPDDEGKWTYTFEELDKYAAGEEISYTVTEEKVDGYETTVDGFSITNKHTPEQTSITVTKKWDDADNKDGIRPSSITVNLLADGTQVSTATLNEGNGWTYTWEELDKKSAGKDISYTVSEDKVEGYTAETTGSAENGYTITNTHVAKPDAVTSDPPVQKIVQGSPATPATFTFQMKAVTEGAPMPDGSADGVKTVQITGSGSYEFGVMTYTQAGEWVYEITELNGGVEGYTYDTSKYTLTITVEEVPDGTQVKLVKTETITGGNGSGTPVFTNVYKAPVPKTGDATPQAGMLALAAAVVTGIAAFGARRRED